MSDNPLAHIPEDVRDELLRSSDVLKARVMVLTLDALDHAEDLIRNGTPDVKLRVMQNVLPVLVKALVQQEEANELDEMRKGMEELRQQMFQAPIDATVREDDGDDGDGQLSNDQVRALIPTDKPKS